MNPTFKTSVINDVSLSENAKSVNNLQIISQQEVLGKDFKVYGTFDDPLFLARDVAEWIEHSDVSTMLRSVDEDEKVTNIVCTLGGNQNAWFLTENGVYEVLMLSRKPIAKAFKKEVKKILKEIRKTGKYIAPVMPSKSQAEIDLENLKVKTHNKEIELERARFLRSLSLSYNGKSETYPQVLDAYAVHEIVGTFALPLPEIKQRLMSAGEVGKILGVSANKIGSIAIKHGLKENQYGAWCRDKSRYSTKEVDTFRYNDKGLDIIKSIIEEEKGNA